MADVIELSFSPGEPIARQGDSIDVLFRLEHGTIRSQVQAIRTDSDAEESRTVAVTSTPGSLLGEGGVDFERRSASLVADTFVVAQGVPMVNDSLTRTVTEQPEFGMDLARSIALRARDIAHGLRLVDSFVASIRREMVDHATAYRAIVDELATRKGRLGELGRNEMESSAYLRGKVMAQEQQAQDAILDQIRASAPGATRTLSPGEYLFSEGEASSSMFVLLNGRLDVIAADRTLDTIRPGETVGEIGAILGGVSSHAVSVKASAESRLLVISFDVFSRVTTEMPSLVLHIVRSLSRRLGRSYLLLSDIDAALGEELDRLDGPDDSVAMDYQRLGHALVEWREDVPEIVSDLRTRLASLRQLTGSVRKGLANETMEIENGISFAEIRAHREFATAISCTKRIHDRLVNPAGEEYSSDILGDLLLALESIRRYTGLTCNIHSRTGEDVSLAEHCVRVGIWSTMIAVHMKLDDRTVGDIGAASVLHDVGMLGAQARKDFRMEKHATEYASPMLARARGVSPEAFRAICQHHEFADGSGYPRRLVGSRISTAGAVLCAANQFDLLVARGLSTQEAAVHMTSEASRYSPQALSAILEVFGGGKQ